MKNISNFAIEYLIENKRNHETVFASSYRAQVEFFLIKRVKISWHCTFKAAAALFLIINKKYHIYIFKKSNNI